MQWVASNGVPQPGDTDSDVLVNLTPLRGTAPGTAGSSGIYALYFTGQGNDPINSNLAASIPAGLTGMAGFTGGQTILAKAPQPTATFAGLVTGMAVLAGGATGQSPAVDQALRDVASIFSKAGYIRYRGFGLTLYTMTFIGSNNF
jgi:hypothetical protein